jgi:hypothetical protein
MQQIIDINAQNSMTIKSWCKSMLKLGGSNV